MKPAQIDPRLAVAVSGQVTDTANIIWSFAVLQFFLVVPSGQTPIDLATGLVIPTPPPVVANAGGNFSISLQPNSTIVPASQWSVSIFPFNDMMQGQTMQPFTVSGALSLTAQILAQLQPISLNNPLLIPLSHNGATGRSNFNGSAYFDVNTQALMLRNPATNSYVSIGSALPPAPTNPIGYLGNAAAAVPMKIITGVSILVAGTVDIVFASPFSGGSVYFSLAIVNNAAVGGPTIDVWVFSGSITGFTVHASSATATNAVQWIAIGSP